jgi:N-acetylglucosaminyldiphosphoundecaprenol N-acetyl-beta-D-mannosaminyltransferase
MPVSRLKDASLQSKNGRLPIFGFRPSCSNIQEVVDTLLSCKRAPQEGVGLVVTPNIQHVAELRRNPAFRAAYSYASIILCDGFPVYYYAIGRGHAVNRITGSDLFAKLLDDIGLVSCNRLFFVVDSERTARAVNEWADRSRLGARVMTHVPPFNFERDTIWSVNLASEIFSHATTLLVMAVGAPRSEIFVSQYRASLPPCWAICVGQSVKVRFGLIKRAPRFFRRINAEWLWRIVQEPQRLLPRYAFSTIAFFTGVVRDLWKSSPDEWPPTDSPSERGKV